MDAEVLAHVKAPSRFIDDRRYVAIAQNVINFKSCKRTEVTNLPDTLSTLHERKPNSPDCSITSAPDRGIVRLSPGLKRKRSFDDRQTSQPNVQSISSPTTHLRYYVGASTAPQNPPYRNPVRNRVLDVLSPTCLASQVVETKSLSSETTSHVIHNSEASFMTKSQPMKHAVHPDKKTASAKRIKADTNEGTSQAPFLSLRHVHHRTGIHGNRAHNAEVSRRGAWTPVARSKNRTAEVKGEGEPWYFPDDTTESTPRHKERGAANAAESFKPSDLLAADHHLTANMHSFSSTKSLPLVIDAPSPTRRQLLAPSYDVPALKTIARTFCMPELFQPKVMTRGVQDKERGYWKVPLTIVASDKVGATTEYTVGPGKNCNGRASYSSVAHFSLTEAEFGEAWETLSEYISRGSAGYSVRAIRRCLAFLSGEGLTGECIDLYLQVYCYGEAIPYIYAVLLACKRMCALYRPLQWISTLDEKPVITMAGDEGCSARLGDWKCERDEHGTPVWLCD